MSQVTISGSFLHIASVLRPSGKSYDDRFTIQTGKHHSIQIIWDAMSVSCAAALYFLQPKLI